MIPKQLPRWLVSLALVSTTVSVGDGCTPRTKHHLARDNVVLIVIDTLRADHLGTYGYERPTSPRLDALATESVVYESCTAQAPWTAPSLGALLTSTLPHANHCGERTAGEDWHGSNHAQMGQLDARLPTLASRLAERGWLSHAVVANPNLVGFGLFRSFQSVDARTGSDSLGRATRPGAANIPCRRSTEITRDAIAWLERWRRAGSDAPFFLLVHYVDPHAPYDPVLAPSEEEVARYAEASRLERGRARAILSYDREIFETDRSVGQLLDYLKATELFEPGLVVVTSDHGEELWDHGCATGVRAPTQVCKPQHGHSVFEELVHVPLLVKYPRRPERAERRVGRIRAPVALIDLVPTILQQLGIDAVGGTTGVVLPQADANPAPQGRMLFAEHVMTGDEKKAVRDGSLKYVLDVETNEERWFDLQRDPGEGTDAGHAVSDRRKARLRRAMQELRGAHGGHEVDGVSQQTLRELETLGYIAPP